MPRQIDPTWEPPLDDPREQGLKDYDRLRQELMLTRDALRAADVDRQTIARRIDDLTTELRQSKAIEAEAVREQISYKTSLEDVARLILAVLKRGVEARKNGDPYSPPAIPIEAVEQQATEIEDLLGKMPMFLTRPNPIN